MLDHGSAWAVGEQVATLLSAAMRDPDQPVARLPLESVARLRDAAVSADRIADAGPHARTVTALVGAVAARRPDACAVEYGGQRLTYRQLVDRAGAVTAAVAGTAVAAVRLPSGPDQLAAWLGVLSAGACLLCLGVEDLGERGRLALAELRPGCLVADPPSTVDSVWYARLMSVYRPHMSNPSLDLNICYLLLSMVVECSRMYRLSQTYHLCRMIRWAM